MLKQEKKIGSSLLIEYFFTKNEFALGRLIQNYLSDKSNDNVYIYIYFYKIQLQFYLLKHFSGITDHKFLFQLNKT